MELICQRDDLKIYCEVHLPGDGRGVYPTVIFGHGFGSNHKLKRHYAKMFADAGIACCIFDFCGGGRDCMSDGRMLDMSVLTEKADMNAVLDAVRRQSFADPDNMFLMGASQGGFVASILAPERAADIRGLILLYPALVIPDDAKKRFPEGAEVPESYDVMGNVIGRKYQEDAVSLLNIYDVICGYEGPVLIIHGDCDDIVPFSYSERAVEVYAHARLVTMQGAGHGFSGTTEEMAGHEAVLFTKKYAENLEQPKEEAILEMKKNMD